VGTAEAQATSPHPTSWVHVDKGTLRVQVSIGQGMGASPAGVLIEGLGRGGVSALRGPAGASSRSLRPTTPE
jgi:hypothetical protein